MARAWPKSAVAPRLGPLLAPASNLLAGAPASVRGVLLMLLGALCSSLMNGVIRYISDDLHPFEIAFFRNLFGLVALVPLFLGTGILQPKRRPGDAEPGPGRCKRRVQRHAALEVLHRPAEVGLRCRRAAEQDVAAAEIGLVGGEVGGRLGPEPLPRGLLAGPGQCVRDPGGDRGLEIEHLGE